MIDDPDSGMTPRAKNLGGERGKERGEKKRKRAGLQGKEKKKEVLRCPQVISALSCFIFGSRPGA